MLNRLSELDPVRINTSISLLAPLPVWCDLTRLWGRLTNIECSDRAVVKYVMVLDLETRMEHGKLLIRVLERDGACSCGVLITPGVDTGTCRCWAAATNRFFRPGKKRKLGA